MPAAVWFALKRSLNCKSEHRDAHDPKGTRESGKTSTKRSNTGRRSGSSRSIANLKDVMKHGTKRHTEKPAICSPRSIGSSELLNPITHEVVLSNSTCEFKLSAPYGFQDGGGVSNVVGMLKPGLAGFHLGRAHCTGFSGSPVRRAASSLSRRGSGFGPELNGPLFCPKCHEEFMRWEAVEEHHLSKHAVTELTEGDSSRKIIEIICRASSAWPKNHRAWIEKILKVHNMQKTLARFEEYREVVKIKASNLSKKHPRCLADGNELLRFHGAVLVCSFGHGSCSLCTSESCHICSILRHGFSTNQELTGGVGVVFTASTSTRALELIQWPEGGGPQRKALIVCRVVAGRVHRPVENIEEMVGQTGFDSVAGKVGVHANIEELYLLSPIALLPCFVVI